MTESGILLLTASLFGLLAAGSKKLVEANRVAQFRVALTILGIGVFFGLSGIQLPVGSHGAGPAVFPLALVVLLVSLCLLFLRSLYREDCPADPEADFLLRPILLALGAGIYLYSIGALGFYICTCIALPLASRALGYKNLQAVMASTLCVLLAIFLLFEKILNISLPEGVLF